MSENPHERNAELIPVIDVPIGSRPSCLREIAMPVHEQLLSHGAVLIRGLGLYEPTDLAEARSGLHVEVFATTEAFVRRCDLGHSVVSPIQWPDDRVLCPFQEGSFSTNSPAFVLTACVTPPKTGGEAHLADNHLILSHLPVHLINKVRKHGWKMTRIFHEGFGISWPEAFLVADQVELEALLTTERIDYRWQSGSLHTARYRPGIINHPINGLECWFNDLAFLNSASMDERERKVLTAAFGNELPMDTALGDGAPLSWTDVQTIHKAYDRVTRTVEWQRGDLLVIDNIRTSQGRAPFDGEADFMIALGGRRPIPGSPFTRKSDTCR